jgi:PAS domain S-box-containing protein
MTGARERWSDDLRSGRRPTRRRRAPAPLAALAALVAAAPAIARAEAVHAHEDVLVLHSYSQDFVWTRSQQEGIDAVFGPLSSSYDLRIEYLDAVHHPELLKSHLVLDLLRAKFAHQRFRVVVTSDNAAFDYARAHRAELFPGVPIVFMGVNGYQDAMLRGETGITGVAEDSDLRGTVQLVLRVLPDVERIVFPGMIDDLTYNVSKPLVQGFASTLPAHVALSFPQYPDVDAALEDLRRLPPRSAIVVMSNMRTQGGDGISSQQVVELVSAAAPAPVFTAWDFVLGHGAVGGSVISGVEQGRWAAEIALQVLRGERPEAIPVHRGVGNTYAFDHRQLERFHIPASRLPPGAVVLFRPERSVRVSREAAILGAATLVLLLGALVSLALWTRWRRRSEAQVREANERFQAILRAATDYSVIGTDPEGRVVVFSEGSSLMLGYAPAEVVGRAVTELLHDPAEVAAQAAELGVAPGFEVLVTVARQGRPQTRVWTYVRKDGTRLPVALTTAAMRGADGALLGFIGIARDITEERRMEQQLIQSQKMETVGLLAGGIAHDFNNLLTPILGHTALLLEDLPPTDPRAEDLREMQAAAQRASDLTHQLLAFSRKQMLSLRTLALADVVRGAERMLRRTLGERIEIEVTVAAEVAPVRADAGQLEQVLMNLAINARDAMPGGGRLGIAVREEVLEPDAPAVQPELRPGRWVVLEVTDTGVGMPPEVLAHLFEPFFTTKERGKGTGLGLSTVYGIVRQHGGTVLASSTPGRGSSFRVYLPAVDGEAATTAPPPPPRPGAQRGGGETILVVEDNDAVRHVTCEMLLRLGYHVLSAPDGERALELARSPGRIDLLLSDVVLPRMNGKEIATSLAARRPDLRVLFMSGYSADVVLDDGRGGDGPSVIQKPLSLDALARKVRDVLERDPGRGDRGRAAS